MKIDALALATYISAYVRDEASEERLHELLKAYDVSRELLEKEVEQVRERLKDTAIIGRFI